jgi:hypothetical protein
MNLYGNVYIYAENRRILPSSDDNQSVLIIRSKPTQESSKQSCELDKIKDIKYSEEEASVNMCEENDSDAESSAEMIGSNDLDDLDPAQDEMISSNMSDETRLNEVQCYKIILIVFSSFV